MSCASGTTICVNGMECPAVWKLTFLYKKKQIRGGRNSFKDISWRGERLFRQDAEERAGALPRLVRQDVGPVRADRVRVGL